MREIPFTTEGFLACLPQVACEPLRELRMGIWRIDSYHELQKAFLAPELESQCADTDTYPSNFARPFNVAQCPWVVAVDGASHQVVRKVIQKRLRSFVERAAAPITQQVTQQIFDELQGLSSIDLVHQVADRIPAQMMARFLGLPPSDSDKVLEWYPDGAAIFSPTNSSAAFDSRRRGILEYLASQLEEKRSKPDTSFLSELAHIEPAQIPEDIALANLVLLSFAGWETTGAAIALLALVLFTDPLIKGFFLERPDEVLQELLRLFTPTQWVQRRVRRRYRLLSGQEVPAGDIVQLHLSAANRDPAVFEEPHRFRLDRRSESPMTFGHGPHFCVGAQLSLLEAQIVGRALLERFPHLQFAEERGIIQDLGLLQRIKALPVFLDGDR